MRLARAGVHQSAWYTMLPLLALVHAWLVPPRAGLVQPRFSHAPRRADLAAMCDMMPPINFMSDEEIKAELARTAGRN